MIEGVRLEEPLPPLPPRERRLPPREWMRANLFSDPLNTVLTVAFSIVMAWAATKAVRFVLFTGQWAVVRANLTNFMVGFFPRDELWRAWAAAYVIVASIGLRWGALRALDVARALSLRTIARGGWPLGLFAVVVITLSASIVPALLILGLVATLTAARLAGRYLPRRVARWSNLILILGLLVAYETVAGFGGVGIDQWRGLLLTVFLAVAGIVLSFPLGVLLALGRRSTLPAVRLVSVVYIELIRGVPLITLLFMAAFTLGFFLPPGSRTPSLVLRALVAMVVFTSAYVAEIVRGGLQSVPRGQVEAAQALGLTAWRVTAFIVLPQALRAVIPAMVGQFISLFKDTSLAAGIGLVELLGIAEEATGQAEFIGRQAESLAFISLVYWVGAYWMSRTSQRLEQRVGVGVR